MGDTFEIIPDAEEMRALTECIRGTLQENVVSEIYKYRHFDRVEAQNCRGNQINKFSRHCMQKKK